MSDNQTVTIVIPGAPVPKGRPRSTRAGGVYTPKRTRDYEDQVAWACRAARASHGNVDVHVTIRFECGRQHGDIDNLAKAVLDGLVKGQAIDDDRQVVKLTVELQPPTAGERTLVVIAAAAHGKQAA